MIIDRTLRCPENSEAAGLSLDERLYISNRQINLFIKNLKKDSQDDFMKYCYYTSYYGKHIFMSNLESFFDKEIIENALKLNIIIPYKNYYYFKAYDFCKERYGKVTESKEYIDSVNFIREKKKCIEEVEQKIKAAEKKLEPLKFNYDCMLGIRSIYDDDWLF